ncbi:Relaxase/Mobilisation nuclease domain-containing protein [Arenibacter nanhaiticus]|uniref:Relaxase/Mobilisation nuclease domain-containing protein n=2 Tax=Arenibacter TaxID=178469 RepID=A0A1M6KAD8_9FLAO|nr:relaxase/mobilization nuclease domain-containing protein [Arenibacter nanhaiticus]SHJ55874.1 Relaxase/Mobilisation nuclease domain-containing protein [Arenibacter nanhaiticus]
MIARLLYRNKVQGVLKYVLGKPESTILGFHNTYSDTDTNLKVFEQVLVFLGFRHASEKRYVHATLNLPRGEHLDDTKFLALAKAYMEYMGYGEQPFIVVRHHDTEHEHVHIVSSTIREDCSQINLSFDYRRSMAAQKYLEKQFGLSPSPEKRSVRELPKLEMPQFNHKESNGVRYYMQDILNNTLQKHKVRSFDELAKLLKEYHIELKVVDRSSRVGVAYGIATKEGYRSRFIGGYTVHPQFSGPKLQQVFEHNRQSALLPMVKKRLEKQIKTTYKLFRTLRPDHLPDILDSHQKLDCRLNYNDQGQVVDFTIHDKTGYVLRSDEIGRGLSIQENPELFQAEHTQMYMDSSQLELEFQRCLREAFQKTYRDLRYKPLFSEHILKTPLDVLVREMMKSERFLFLKKHLHTDNRTLWKVITSHYYPFSEKLYTSAMNKEKQELQKKADLIQRARDRLFTSTLDQREVLGALVQSLGARYNEGTLTYANSKLHQVPVDLGSYLLQTSVNPYVPPGFARENEKLLEGLLHGKSAKEIKPGPTALFLPMVFPKLYNAMVPTFRERYDTLALKAYHGYAERMQAPFEKSPRDYIAFFNARGFYFEEQGGKLWVGSLYSKYKVTVALSTKMQDYLLSSPELPSVMARQPVSLNHIIAKGQDNLKSLWMGHLMECGLYKQAAYSYVLDRITPNLPLELVEHHMANGFKEALVTVANERERLAQANTLRAGWNALETLMGPTTSQEEEAYNGFKDELTDYSKYKENWFLESWGGLNFGP